MLTDTIIEDDRWHAVGLETLAEEAARAALRHLDLDPVAFEIVVLACDDTRIAALNADFREKPMPTNVLSWPASDLAAEIAGTAPPPPTPGELGDVAIAYETCNREATEQNKPITAHVTHLIVHAVLHLLGYDHIRDLDATLMEGHERAILARMGLPDPYV